MSKVTNPTLFPPSEDELASIAQAGSTLSKLSCHFTPPSIDAIDAIQDEVALLDAGEGVDVILVDYIQLVDGIRHRGDTRETEVASVSKGLRSTMRLCSVSRSSPEMGRKFASGRAEVSYKIAMSL